MTNELRRAINRIMYGYKLTESDILWFIALGAAKIEDQALIDCDDELNKKMRDLYESVMSSLDFKYKLKY